jgi:hypothetical protein
MTIKEEDLFCLKCKEILMFPPDMEPTEYCDDCVWEVLDNTENLIEKISECTMKNTEFWNGFDYMAAFCNIRGLIYKYRGEK